MFRIRKEQFELFGNIAWKDFIIRAITHLRQDISRYSAGFTDEELSLRIQRCAALAASYGLVDEYDIMCFLDAGLILGEEDFPMNPRFRAIRSLLADERLTSGSRAEQTLIVAAQRVLVR